MIVGNCTNKSQQDRAPFYQKGVMNILQTVFLWLNFEVVKLGKSINFSLARRDHKN